MKRYEIAIVIILNVTIALGFYVTNTNAKIQDISSDLANIIPVCKKIDNPSLYKNDLYLNTVENVRYYTPFYVQPLRYIATFTNYDYLKALNFLGFVTHVFYGLFWFFLCYTIKKDYWIALIFSVFVRGVLWPPGGELLGISDLWTIMPRTLYTALMPLPFLIFVYSKKYRVLLSSLVLGFIFNFHPISGVGGILIYFLIYTSFLIMQQSTFLVILKKTLWFLFFCTLGMLPFLLIYTSNVSSEVTLDKNLLNTALHSRISDIFFDPILFIKSWNRPVTYIFGILFLSFYFFDTSNKKQAFKLLSIGAIGVFMAANLSVYVEIVINTFFNKNMLLSFQLIRFQKFILVLFQIGIYLLGVALFDFFKIQKPVKIMFFLMFMGLLAISNNQNFNTIPLLGDDVSRSILPRNLQYYKSKPQDYSYSHMVAYVENNTPIDAVFFGYNSFLIRAGASRAVVFDNKGASMLIEGNQKQFLNWHFNYQKLKTLNEQQTLYFLKSKKVDYYISNTPIKNLILEKKINNVYIYKL